MEAPSIAGVVLVVATQSPGSSVFVGPSTKPASQVGQVLPNLEYGWVIGPQPLEYD